MDVLRNVRDAHETLRGDARGDVDRTKGMGRDRMVKRIEVDQGRPTSSKNGDELSRRLIKAKTCEASHRRVARCRTRRDRHRHNGDEELRRRRIRSSKAVCAPSSRAASSYISDLVIASVTTITTPCQRSGRPLVEARFGPNDNRAARSKYQGLD